jgi:hypothetical protein
MFCASAAWADIYRWTDKDGNVNYSDVAPPREQQVADVVVVTKTSKVQPATPTQQELLARIQNLEQQLQSQQASMPAPMVAAPPVYAAYHAPPVQPPVALYQAPPVPPVTYFDAGYDSSAYAPAFVSPSLFPVAPVFVVTTTRLHPARFGSAHRTHGRGAFHGNRGGGGRGAGRPGGRR